MSGRKKNVFDDVSTDDDFSSQAGDNNEGAAAAQPTQVKHVDSNAKAEPKRSQQRDPEEEEEDNTSEEESSEDNAAAKIDSPPVKQRESLPSNAPPTVRHIDPQDEEEEAEEEEEEEPAPKKAPAKQKKDELVFMKTQPDPAEKVQQDINQKDMKVSTSVANTPQKAEAEQPAPNRRQNVEPEEDDSYYYYSSSKSGADQESRAAGGGAGGHANNYDDDDEDEEENEHRMLLDYVLNEDDDASDWTRYLFPRFDRRLMNYEYNKDNLAATGKLTKKDPMLKDSEEEEAPNAIEVFVAYIIAGDMRLSTCAAFVLLAMIFTIAAIPTSQIDLPGRQCYTFFGYKENCDRSTYYANVNFIPCDGIKHRLQAGAAFIIISLAFELFTFVSLLLMVFCSPIRRKKVQGGQHGNIPLTQADSNQQQQQAENEGKGSFNNYYLYHREQQVETVASCRSRWIIGGISLANIAFLLIPWAIIAGIVTSKTCLSDPTSKAQYDSVITALNLTSEIEYNTAKYYSYGVGFGLAITAWALNAFGLFVLLVTPVALI